LLDLYIRLTSQWPQKRWVISVGLAAQISSASDPSRALHDFIRTDLADADQAQVLAVMRRMHAPARITRDLGEAELINDWLNTRGAVIRHFLAYLNEGDILGSSDYQSLLVTQHIEHLDKIRDWASVAETLGTAFAAAQSHPGLARVFRLGFMRQDEMRRRVNAKSGRYVKLLNDYIGSSWHTATLSLDAWNALGRIVVQGLVQAGLMPAAHWVLWGFPAGFTVQDQ